MFDGFPFPIMFDGFSSFSTGLRSMMIQLISASFKESDEKCGLNHVDKTKISHKVLRISHIFDRINSPIDTNNLCKFQKNQIENVAFIT